MEKIERVAFLGLGIMGSRMAANLARAGFELTVWNRTTARAEALAEEHPVSVAASPAEAARDADAVVTMLVDGPQVEEVLFGEDGAATALAPGALAVDMSTIAPATARELAERLGERGIGFLDAPVTGSKPAAGDGTLLIMAGGASEDFARAEPLFDAMGRQALHVGPNGHGQVIKLINNGLAAINAAAVAEALTFGRKAGVDLDSLLEVVRAGSGGSFMLELKARPMLEHDFDPLFKLAHMLKDIRHCLGAAEEAGARLRMAEQAERLYAAGEAEGHGDEDFAAIVAIAEGAAGLAGPMRAPQG